MNRAVAAFFRLAVAGVIEQNAPHNLRRNSEKLRAVLPRRARLVNQFQVGFVDERGRLQSMIRVFALHKPMRDAPEFLLDDWKKPFERMLVAVRPSREQFGDVRFVRHSARKRENFELDKL